MSSNSTKTLPSPGVAAASVAGFSPRDRLLRSIAEDTSLPALGSSISRVIQLASSDDEAVRNLAHFVLSDVALTQKVLRLANTVLYRSYSTTPITTISKAIFVLGFDLVKTSALAMLLVEGMSGMQALSVRSELAQALTASVIGREMARRSQFKDAEEAAVAALFRNMGKLLVASHDHYLYNEIESLVNGGTYTPTRASTEVLGCSFDFLAEVVLQEWQIPDTIVKALSPLPSGVLRVAKSRQEWIQQVAAFSSAAALLVTRHPAEEQPDAMNALLDRFGTALDLDEESIKLLFENVLQETQALSDQTTLVSTQTEVHIPQMDFEIESFDDMPGDAVDEEQQVPAELVMTVADGRGVQARNTSHPSGKPMNAREQLMAGVQDVTEMIASGRCKVNDLIMSVLETLYTSMGFRFATICIKDLKTSQFRARMSLGEKNVERQAGFVFSEAASRNIFHLAMENDADLIISDATTAKIRSLIPAWHQKLIPDAGSFIILPLVINKKPFGFFYADRACAALEGVPPDETALIKILKDHVVAALKARS